MPIEIWWWLEPMCETGMLTMLICGGFSLLLGEIMYKATVPIIIALIGILPFVISFFGFVAWILTNAMYVIWRC